MHQTEEMRFNPLLQRALWMLRPDGIEREPVVIQIGMPYWTIEDVEAACPVALEGLHPNLPDVRSIDMICALQEAITFSDLILKKMQQHDGYHFFWHCGDEYFE